MNDVLTLIEVVSAYDANGFKTESEGAKVNVFAQALSIGTNEFYTALNAGYTDLNKFKVYAMDYNNQKMAEYKGEKFNIIRIYALANTDFLELTLQRVSKG